MICFIRRIWSSVSRMVKSDLSPTSSAWRRSILAPIEWKVPSHCMPSTTPPIRSPMRFFISRAALLVKVTERISHGRAPLGGEDMGDAGGEHARLAGAGAGEHQHRPVERLDGAALLGVQLGEIRLAAPGPSPARRCRRDEAGARPRRCRRNAPSPLESRNSSRPEYGPYPRFVLARKRCCPDRPTAGLRTAIRITQPSPRTYSVV